MVRGKDVNPANIIFDSGTTTILNGIHDAVDHNLGAEGVIAGHGNHANSYIFAARRNAFCIRATAFGASTVVRHIGFQCVERFAIAPYFPYWTVGAMKENALP